MRNLDKILIVGAASAGLTARIKGLNPDLQVEYLSAEDAKAQGLGGVSAGPIIIDDAINLEPKPLTHIFQPPLTRRERRAKARKK